MQLVNRRIGSNWRLLPHPVHPFSSVYAGEELHVQAGCWWLTL
jgi:hypothetical protein